MDNVENLSQLEVAIDKLLQSLNEMKQEKIVLTARLGSKDQEIISLKQQLQVFQDERSDIEQRVNGLLGSIDKWEKLNEAGDVVEKSEPVEEVKTLF